MFKKSKIMCCVRVFLGLTLFCGVFIFPILKSESVAAQDLIDAEKQMELVKAEMENSSESSRLMKRYNILKDLLDNCSPLNQLIEKNNYDNLFSPAANLCISGASLSATDPTFQRANTTTTGSGVSSPCALLGFATAVPYDVYNFNLTSCATFPTVVTTTLCGPAGCAPPANTDTSLYLYRSVPSGNALTANGGLPNSFSPTAACTNLVAANDDLNTIPTATGGSSCNQNNTSDCLATCTGRTSTSGVKRTLGSGMFTVVVAGFNNSTTGNYNLYVDAPGAGCAVTLIPPTAAGVSVGGRVLTGKGQGISRARLTLQGGNMTEPLYAQSNGFGYYRFADVPAGQTYVISVSAKRYQFSNPIQVVNVFEELTDFNFIAEPERKLNDF